jgi:GT2 family glycosyltransferase
MKVYIAIYTTGTIRKELAFSLIQWIQSNKDKSIFINFVEQQPIENARNIVVQEFLKTDNQYLLQIDNDTIPSQNPLELINLSLDVVSCPCPIYQGTILWNYYRLDKDGFWEPGDVNKDKGLVEVDAVGTGCVLINRKVLESIKNPFSREWNEDGIATLGLDLSFSKKVKDMGFKIHTHLDYKCSHYKTVDLKNFR